MVVLAAGLAGLGPSGPLSIGSPALAQTAADKDRIDDKISSVRGQANEASREESRLLGLIDASSDRKRELEAKVAALDSQIAGFSRQIQAAEGKLGGIEFQRKATEARLAGAEHELTQARTILARQAIAAYTGQTDAARYATMLLSSDNVGDLAAKRSYLKAAVGTQTSAVAEDEHLRNEVTDLRDQLSASRAKAQAQRDVIAAQRTRIEQGKAAQVGVRQQVDRELAERNRLRDEALARKKEFQAQEATLRRESAGIAELLRRRAAAQAARPPAASGTGGAASAAPAVAPGRLSSPIPGAPITSGFGPRVHPIYGDVRMHTGVDYGASTGTPIRAAADGVVVSAEVFGGYGNATVIEHGGGLATLYGHQSSMAVSAGQRVSVGQVIGRVGCTGACTGPHLHFEVRVNGDPVNPVGYL